MEAFRRENAAQLASRAVGPTFPLWNEQIDHIFADYGWEVRASRAWPVEISDHLPVTAELMGERAERYQETTATDTADTASPQAVR